MDSKGEKVKPRYVNCRKCHLPIDRTKIYTVVFIDEEDKEGVSEVIYHIECFHEDYTPQDKEEFAA